MTDGLGISQPSAPPAFGTAFRAELLELMRWRRDVRHFQRTPVDDALIGRCLRAFSLAPSVGLSEPWRIVQVESDHARQAVRDNFEAANARALSGYAGESAKLYAGLKLAGLAEAPVQLAVFCDDTTEKGGGLGAATMPEMRAYSVVAAISYFWLSLRAEGLGLGWVSILDPAQLAQDLAVPAGWHLVGYLCVGYPEATDCAPELERVGWESRAKKLNIEKR